MSINFMTLKNSYLSNSIDKLNNSGQQIYKLLSTENMRTSVILKIRRSRNHWKIGNNNVRSYDDFLKSMYNILYISSTEANDRLLLKVQQSPKFLLNFLTL